MDENDKIGTNVKEGSNAKNGRGRPKKDAKKKICIPPEAEAEYAKFAKEDATAKSACANAKSSTRNATPKVSSKDAKSPETGDCNPVDPKHPRKSSRSKSTTSTESSRSSRSKSTSKDQLSPAELSEIDEKARALAEFTFWNCIPDENGNYLPTMPPDLDDEDGLTIDIIANNIDPELLEMIIAEINKKLQSTFIDGTIETPEKKDDLDLEQKQEDDLDLEQNDQSKEVETSSGCPIIPKFEK